jgi:hypothetical protein
VSLKDSNISSSEINKIVENAYNIAKVWQMDKDYTKKVLTEILKNADD